MPVWRRMSRHHGFGMRYRRSSSHCRWRHGSKSGRVAAVDGQACTGNEARTWAGQVGHEVRGLVGMRVALQRDVFPCLLREFARGGVHVGICGAGLDVVDRDAAWTQITRQALRQPGDGGLSHHIERAAVVGHVVAVDAANIDDAAVFAHMAQPLLASPRTGL